jgi:hypothetical protein
MHRFVLACTSCVTVLAACSGSNQQKAADSTAVATPPAAPPAPPPLAFSDVAGKWNLRVTNEAGDSTLLTEVMNATATPTGWTVVRGKLKAQPVRPAVAGDSLITEGGPYPSALRKGVKVTTHTVWRLQDGKLVGTTTAHYSVKTADSVRTLHIEGTRAQQ